MIVGAAYVLIITILETLRHTKYRPTNSSYSIIRTNNNVTIIWFKVAILAH